MKIRYHHWLYDIENKELTSYIKETHQWVVLEPTGYVLDVLRELSIILHGRGKKMITVAECDGIWELAIQHDMDQYNRKRGNAIAGGRLRKMMQEKGLI